MPSITHPDGRWPFDVLEIIEALDGDTVRLRCDHGHGHSYSFDLRLRGIKAPEIEEPGGIESRDALLNWIHSFPQDDLKVTTYRRITGKETWVKSFDRWVGDLEAIDRTLIYGPGDYMGDKDRFSYGVMSSAALYLRHSGFARFLDSGESE